MTRPKLKTNIFFLFAYSYFYFCTSHYFRKADVKDVNDDIEFWKKLKPFFSDKDSASSNTVLKENGRFSP